MNKPTIDEIATKYADQYLWVQNTRDREGWGDDLKTRRVLLINMMKKALEENET